LERTLGRWKVRAWRRQQRPRPAGAVMPVRARLLRPALGNLTAIVRLVILLVVVRFGGVVGMTVT
jgi:hypothetical protein